MKISQAFLFSVFFVPAKAHEKAFRYSPPVRVIQLFEPLAQMKEEHQKAQAVLFGWELTLVEVV